MSSRLGLFAIALVLGTGQVAAAQQAARIGDVAPVFSLVDTTGAGHSLSEYAGKIVVLEWFNADCPAVKKVHKDSHAMVDAAAKYAARGVVWLAVCSSGPGKQGEGQARNARAVTEYGMPYPILLDPTGVAGHAYGARSTPTMVVIDAQGHVAYRGGFQDPAGNDQVGAAIDALLDGKAPTPAETQAFG